MGKAAKYTVRESAKDWRGAEYRAGTRVYYPRMSGRSCELTEAEVVEIRDRQQWSWKDDGPTEMVVVLKPLRSSRFRHGVVAGLAGGWGKSSEAVTISVTENITVIDSKIKPLVPFSKDSVEPWHGPGWQNRELDRELWTIERALYHKPTETVVYALVSYDADYHSGIDVDEMLLEELMLLVPDKKR